MSSQKEIDIKELARGISKIENKSEGYENLLFREGVNSAKVIGITGAPGSGKSTLTDALIQQVIADEKKVAVLCVDPSSPFNRGALLGDRIRMSDWYNHPGVFIRSLASRGSLGGLHPHIIEITEYVKHEGFDYVIIETVGVGQSEVDIAALADITIVVLVPESGDSIQSMKAGLMEIADAFVVNKSDRPDADTFYNNLKKMTRPVFRDHKDMKPIFKTIASERKGVERLYEYVKKLNLGGFSEEKRELLIQKGFTLLQSLMMERIDQKDFKIQLNKMLDKGQVDLFSFVRQFADKIK